MKLDRKNKLFVFGILVILYICYAFAFSNTYTYYKEYRSQKELASNNLNNPEVLGQLVQKEKQLNALLGQYNTVSGNSFQNELLKNLSVLSQKNSLQITDFREPHVYTEKEITCYTYMFSVQGSFNGIMLMINSIENSPALGRILHIAFEKRKDYKNNTDYLVAEIILQKNENVKGNK